MREVKTMKRNRSICWIDYKKVYIANVYCNNIGMEFGLDKGVVLEMKWGETVQYEGIELPTGEMTKELYDDEYKYLGLWKVLRF